MAVLVHAVFDYGDKKKELRGAMATAPFMGKVHSGRQPPVAWAPPAVGAAPMMPPGVRCALGASGPTGAAPGGIGDFFAHAVHAAAGGGGYGMALCGGVPHGLAARVAPFGFRGAQLGAPQQTALVCELVLTGSILEVTTMHSAALLVVETLHLPDVQVVLCVLCFGGASSPPLQGASTRRWSIVEPWATIRNVIPTVDADPGGEGLTTSITPELVNF